MARAHVGCSGFSYDHWRGVFYPADVAKSRWLRHYAGIFSTVELNVTFYRLPWESAFEKWAGETPEDFLISIKGSRYITHVKRLLEPEEPLKRLFERIKPIAGKLGAVLWQFPPNFGKDTGRLENFVRALKPYKVRHAFEFREASWTDGEVASLLAAGGHALCMADWPEFLDRLPLTADFVYMRRHGHGSYADNYTLDELKKDAERIRSYLKQGRDVFIYFNNDAFGYAPKNALELMALLGLKR
jgi:uncharacterized protein YecE (DUF72 family)